MIMPVLEFQDNCTGSIILCLVTLPMLCRLSSIQQFFSYHIACLFTIYLIFQVAIFLVLGMVLRRKPDVLINLLPTLRENSKYQGQDKLPVLIWMTVQVSC